MGGAAVKPCSIKEHRREIGVIRRLRLRRRRRRRSEITWAYYIRRSMCPAGRRLHGYSVSAASRKCCTASKTWNDPSSLYLRDRGAGDVRTSPDCGRRRTEERPGERPAAWRPSLCPAGAPTHGDHPTTVGQLGLFLLFLGSGHLGW